MVRHFPAYLLATLFISLGVARISNSTEWGAISMGALIIIAILFDYIDEK